jgi:hypothetical protein
MAEDSMTTMVCSEMLSPEMPMEELTTHPSDGSTGNGKMGRNHGGFGPFLFEL